MTYTLGALSALSAKSIASVTARSHA